MSRIPLKELAARLVKTGPFTVDTELFAFVNRSLNDQGYWAVLTEPVEDEVTFIVEAQD